MDVGADGCDKPSGRVNGADSYLAKPLNRVELLVHAKVLSGGRVRYAGYYGPNDQEPTS